MSLLLGLSKIKNGIEKENWEEVKSGYELLSGETVQKKELVVEKQTKKRGRPKSTKTPQLLESFETPEAILIGKHKKPNKFTDDGTLFPEDKIIDRLLHVSPPQPRTRKSDIVTVSCQGCSKSFEISKSLILGDSRLLCNNCCKRS